MVYYISRRTAKAYCRVFAFLDLKLDIRKLNLCWICRKQYSYVRTRAKVRHVCIKQNVIAASQLSVQIRRRRRNSKCADTYLLPLYWGKVARDISAEYVIRIDIILHKKRLYHKNSQRLCTTNVRLNLKLRYLLVIL